MPKPQFIIAGFQKCGTTAIKHILQESGHFDNDVYIPDCLCDKCPNEDEINFFTPRSETIQYGIEWYENLFKDGFINGEKSPSYCINSDFCAKHIHSYYPDIKIILSMRNPVDRTISAYNHYMQVLPESKDWGNWNPKKSLIWNFKRNNTFKLQGEYLSHIKNYLKYFKGTQILLVIQEKLKDENQYQNEWDRICDFLDIKRRKIEQSYHHSREKTENIGAADIEKIKEYFRPLNKQLFEFIGTEIKKWDK